MATYLLAIGVNRYDDHAFTALSCCENDAHEIHSLFKRTLGLGERARKLVGAVTLKDCKDELRRLGQQVRNGDTFVLFFAGHGYQHPRGEEQYLLFPEADYRLVQGGFADGMFSLSALCTLTDDWPGVQRVFVLDACRAWLPGRQAQGAVFHNQQALARIATRDPSRPMPARPGGGSAPAAAPQARPPLILNATHDGQAAHELTHAGRGVLALALEQALEAQFQPGQPLWLGPALLHSVQERMQALLAQAGIGVEQSPLLLPADGQALLYQPPPAPLAPAAPAQPSPPSPPSPPTHPPARPDTPATPAATRQGWRFRHALIYGAISLACALPWVLWNARQYESAATRQLMHQAFSQAFSQASSQAARQDHGQWRQLRVFEGHESYVTSVAFSPDGQLALSGSWDKTLRLWRVDTGQTLRVFKGHEYGVLSVAFSPDGQLALSGSRDHTLRLWRVDTGQTLHVFKGHEDVVRSVAFSPDGQLALSGSFDNTLRLWRVDTGETLRVLQGHEDAVLSVAFSPDGQLALSGSGDNTLRLWRVDTGQTLRVFKGHASDVTSVAFSPDGQLALSGSLDDTLRLWRVDTGQTLRVLQGHENTVTSVAFSPDGQFALSGSTDKTLRLWRVDTGEAIRTFTGDTSADADPLKGVWSVTFSPDGRYALSGSVDQTLRLWGAPSR